MRSQKAVIGFAALTVSMHSYMESEWMLKVDPVRQLGGYISLRRGVRHIDIGTAIVIDLGDSDVAVRCTPLG